MLDPLPSRELDFVMTGWPEKCDEEELRPYHICSQELSCEQSCVLWGSRVIIPQVFREKMLKELHWEHPGTCAMKAIARTCVWWPKMDKEIEKEVKLCTECKEFPTLCSFDILEVGYPTLPAHSHRFLSKESRSILSRD